MTANDQHSKRDTGAEHGVVHDRVAPAALRDVARDIAQCRLCRDAPVGSPLPHEPRPVAQLSSTARICIAGQAPGTRVHASLRPFTDPSGDRLRDWLGLDEETFYDPRKIAIVPMGFCFPGLNAKGADLPPRKECVATWHDDVFDAMPNIALVIVIGQYAHAYHLGAQGKSTLTETVAAWRDIARTPNARGHHVWPLPHPSWRNSGWLKRNPWFETGLLPPLRAAVQDALAKGKVPASSLREP